MPNADKRPPTPEEVRMAEIALGETKIHERHKTIRIISIGFFAICALGIIALAVVKLADPPWVKLLVSVFGPGGIIIVAAKIYLSRLSKK
jgi:hypothetical protein